MRVQKLDEDLAESIAISTGSTLKFSPAALFLRRKYNKAAAAVPK